MGHQLVQVLLVLLLATAGRATTAPTAAAGAVALAGLDVAWTAGFPRLRGAEDGLCGVAFVAPLRVGAAAAVLATAAAALVVSTGALGPSDGWLALRAVWAVAALLAAWGARRAHAAAVDAALEAINASGLAEAAELLENMAGRLLPGGAAGTSPGARANGGGGDEPTAPNRWGVATRRGASEVGAWAAALRRAREPRELGELLLDFESRLRGERLDPAFVRRRRRGWRAAASRAGRFSEAAALAVELQGALRSPPYPARVAALVRQVLRAKRSARHVAPRILGFVLGAPWGERAGEAFRRALVPTPSALSAPSEPAEEGGGGGGSGASGDPARAPVSFETHMAVASCRLREFSDADYNERFLFPPPLG